MRQLLRRFLKGRPSTCTGFTLTELLIAAGIGTFVVLVAGDAMLSNARSNLRAQELQRLRNDWSRATSFIESEIAMSERVFTDSKSITIPTDCNLSPSEFRMALDIRRDLPPIIYGVKSTASMTSSEQRLWNGSQVLMRCGPAIGSGVTAAEDYLSLGRAPLSSTVLIDSLNDDEACNASNHSGFCVTSNSPKAASFILSLKNLKSSNTFTFGAGSVSRINPVTAFPEDFSGCDRACKLNSSGQMECSDNAGIYFLKGTHNQPDSLSIPYEAIDDNDNTMICSLGGNDVIAGTRAHDVLDAGRFSNAGALVNGGSGGRNLLFGTPLNDVLTGGQDEDTLVGRGGNDVLDGKDGNNSYLPWVEDHSRNGNTTIIGGNGLDVVFIRDLRQNYSGLESCTKAQCTVTRGSASLSLSKVDVLIFRDGRIDLP